MCALCSLVRSREADPYSDTPGKRPLNPGMGAEPESSASYNLMTAGQCHRI